MTGPPYDVPDLRFGWDALAPAIGEGALRAHHEGVHKGYRDALNRMLAPPGPAAGRSVEAVLSDPAHLPPAIRDAVLDVAGAHANHQFFWKVISASRGTMPRAALAAAIARDFGSLHAFHAAFRAAALSLDGPGWAFLSLTAPRDERLEVLTLPGNWSVLGVGKPGILACDLWDHAWAADHASREDWLKAFPTLIDWDVCTARYDALRRGDRPA